MSTQRVVVYYNANTEQEVTLKAYLVYFSSGKSLSAQTAPPVHKAPPPHPPLRILC